MFQKVSDDLFSYDKNILAYTNCTYIELKSDIVENIWKSGVGILSFIHCCLISFKYYFIFILFKRSICCLQHGQIYIKSEEF